MQIGEQILALFSEEMVLISFLLIVGAIVAQIIARRSKKILESIGIPEVIEGTSLERTMGKMGTSTVIMVSKISMWLIIGGTVLLALTILDVNYSQRVVETTADIFPSIFISLLIFLAGIVVGDKAEILVARSLRGVKLSEVGIIPKIAKYSVIYISVLIVLGQLDVATNALVVLLGVYALSIVAFSAVAFSDMLKSTAAGLYLVLTQPYVIGDEIRVGDTEGIVQEITMLVTRVESVDEECVIPNDRVFREGVSRKINRD